MGSYYQEDFHKEIFVYEQIIKPYHPLMQELVKTSDMEMLMDYMSKHNMFNLEYLVEQCVSFIGGIEQSGEHGEDFKDMSELKLVSLTKDRAGYRAKIRNIHRKKDLIRLIVYNKVRLKLDYFVFRLTEIDYDKSMKKEFRPYYSSLTDKYSIIEPYRVSSFKELCLRN